MPKIKGTECKRERMTVFFTLNSFVGGGAERSTIQIAQNFETPSLSPALLAGSLTGPYYRAAKQSVPISVVGRLTILRIPHYIASVRRAITRNRAVAIVTYGAQAKTLLAARLLRLIPAVAIVVVGRNDFASKARSKRNSRVSLALDINISKLLFRRADAIIGISQGVTDGMVSLLAGSFVPTTTIYNPIDVQQILDSIRETSDNDAESSRQTPDPKLRAKFDQLVSPRIISVGRLVRQKGQADLLKAFALIPETRRGSLVILGDGPLRKSLQDQAELLGVSNALWMPGFVDNPWWFIANSDVFALPSHFEGFARVLVEALACKVPVVATDCPSGPREILEGLPQARLCPVGEPVEFADAMMDFLDRPPETVTAPFHRYDPRRIADQFATVVTEATRRKGLSQF